MWGFLWAHWAYAGVAVAVLVGFVAVGLLGGWSLVLNRRVIGACGCVLACVAGALAYQAWVAAIRAEGAAACVAANVRATEDQATAKRLFEMDQSDSVKEQQDRLLLTFALIDREKSRHVSKAADAACVIPRGFVRDHNADVPGAPASPDLPQPQTGDDLPSGLVLSRVDTVVGHNYGECKKLLAERASAEEQRYQSCLAWDKRFNVVSGCTR